MHKDDQIRLRYMLDAALEAMAFTKNYTSTSLNTDRMLVLSLVKENLPVRLIMALAAPSALSINYGESIFS
jgi:hypothetical protein